MQFAAKSCMPKAPLHIFNYDHMTCSHIHAAGWGRAEAAWIINNCHNVQYVYMNVTIVTHTITEFFIAF